MIQNISPFKFGQIVDSDFFTNRHEEIEMLGNHLLSGNHIIVISPRRYGKSSLIRQFVTKSSDNQDVIHCLIDLFSIHSEEEFYETLARELIVSTSGKFEEWVQSAKTFFKQLVPRISVGIDPLNDFSVSFDIKEVVKHKREVLNLAETIAIQKKKRIIVYLDEFQNIASFQNSLQFQKTLRSEWQQTQNVSYCMFGSKRHMMSEIFNQSEKPFYRFGSLLFLDRVKTGHWVDYIVSKFNETGKSISIELATVIADSMKNHPHYVQQLSHFVWSFSGEAVTSEVIDHSIEFMINSNSPLFVKMIEEISNTQINLLKAISQGERYLSASKTMQNYNLGTPRNVAKNKTSLENKDIIEIGANEIRFIDPLFEIWFKRTC